MHTSEPQDTTTAIIPSIIERLRANQTVFDGCFPSYGNGDNAYYLTPNENWLASFWSGLLWLTYAVTGVQADQDAAAALLPTFAARLDKNIRLNHDLGFLFTLSARAQYQLTGDVAARELALRGADALMARFLPDGQYIQAWGELGDIRENGRFIIDCMMNLPLLFWASAQTGDPRYREAAVAHAATSQRHLLRPDGSTYHTFFLNPKTGQPGGPKTHQGYADASVWARGQAWAIFGFAVAAQWIGDSQILDCACSAADFYLRTAPMSSITPWDLALPADAPQYPDSSADATAAAGLLRLGMLTGEARYREAAHQLLTMLQAQAFDWRENAQGLLRHGTQHAPSGYGIDTYTIFGDYFFFESLLQLSGNAPDFWGPVGR